MKNVFTLIITTLFLVQCSSVKKSQRALNQGNYETSMESSLKALVKDKNKKGNQNHIMLLEDAFGKYQTEVIDDLNFLNKENNSESLRTRYNLLLNLQQYQDRIRALLPLTYRNDGREASFTFKPINEQLMTTKAKMIDFLYEKSKSVIISNTINKSLYRDAFADLRYIENLFSNYKETQTLMNQALEKGRNFVLVTLKNDTQTALPIDLENALLDIDTYGLDDQWTSFMTASQAIKQPDYEVVLNFTNIMVSPERVSEKQMVQEKRIKDGFEYVLDSRGNVKKDSLGNDIKVDKFKTVTCNFYQFDQLKTAMVNAELFVYNTVEASPIDRKPIQSEFIFEHHYANLDGDRRALENDLVALLELAAIPFPSNEQMIFDAGEDIKKQLIQYLKRNQF